MKSFLLILLLIVASSLLSFDTNTIRMEVIHTVSLDSLGACQGIHFQHDRIFLYGDREVGMIREYKLEDKELVYQHKELKLTQEGKDLINHPTGIAYNGVDPTFIGNSIRLNKEGTAWKAVIYCVNWEGLLSKGTLDGNIFNVIEDDACIQGTRPEYVKYRNKWYVATADYGNKANEVRLYDPAVLEKASKTSEKGVLFKKFTCGAWVQNLHWIPEKDVLILIQNQVEGIKWRFTYLDLKKSIESGKQVVLQEIDLEKADELEGFSMISAKKGIGVTSSSTNNAHLIDVHF